MKKIGYYIIIFSCIACVTFTILFDHRTYFKHKYGLDGDAYNRLDDYYGVYEQKMAPIDNFFSHFFWWSLGVLILVSCLGVVFNKNIKSNIVFSAIVLVI